MLQEPRRATLLTRSSLRMRTHWRWCSATHGTRARLPSHLLRAPDTFRRRAARSTAAAAGSPARGPTRAAARIANLACARTRPPGRFRLRGDVETGRRMQAAAAPQIFRRALRTCRRTCTGPRRPLGHVWIAAIDAVLGTHGCTHRQYIDLDAWCQQARGRMSATIDRIWIWNWRLARCRALKTTIPLGTLSNDRAPLRIGINTYALEYGHRCMCTREEHQG